MIVEAARPVVVGIDGSTGSLTAALLAAIEAEVHGRVLRLVAASGSLNPPAVDRREDASRWLAQAVREIGRTHPTLVMDRRAVPGDLANVLIDASHGAHLVVVAADLPAQGERRAVTIGEEVAAHASRPVLLAREGLTGDAGPILVGVDGSATDQAALAFAFAEAAVRGLAVRPTYVWTGAPDSALDTLDPFAYELSRAQADADRLLAESLAGWSEKYPDVLVERSAVLDANVGAAMVRLSRTAAMAVVCARSHPRMSPLLIGSVTRNLLRFAHCPVAVVQPPVEV